MHNLIHPRAVSCGKHAARALRLSAAPPSIRLAQALLCRPPGGLPPGRGRGGRAGPPVLGSTASMETRSGRAGLWPSARGRSEARGCCRGGWRSRSEGCSVVGAGAVSRGATGPGCPASGLRRQPAAGCEARAQGPRTCPNRSRCVRISPPPAVGSSGSGPRAA